MKKILLTLTLWALSSCMGNGVAIALELFNADISQSLGRQAVVLEFVNRYFSELLNKDAASAQRQMRDDKVCFLEGSLLDLTEVNDSMAFSISFHDKHYFVNWLREESEQPFVSIVFPAQYDLILGQDQDEAKKNLKLAIEQSSECPIQSFKPSSLQTVSDGIGMVSTEFYELESLNDSKYFYNQDNMSNPVFDSAYLEYSAANLFQGLIDSSGYQMYVTQSTYGLQTINYTITLKQWLNYVTNQGLKTFFGIEEVREDGILAIIVAQSQELGYDHLLSVVLPADFVDNSKTVLKVRLTPYIPKHNVKNLYQQEVYKHKKKLWM